MRSGRNRGPALRENLFNLFAPNHTPSWGAGSLRELSACRTFSCLSTSPPKNVFRVIILQFIDAASFDVGTVKKSAHFIHPDGRLIPFDTYNLFYRDELERDRLGPRRQQAEGLAPLLRLGP
jgi:hypothetical protein